MKTDVAYEIVDRRQTMSKLKPIGIIQLQPGSVSVVDTDLQIVTIQPDQDEQLIEHDDGSIDLRDQNGTITLIPLTRESFVPLATILQIAITADSDEALGRAVYQAILESRE